jgi:Sugar-binding N-terminal domain
VTSVDPAAPAPAFSGAISLDQLLADQPPELDVGANFDEVKTGRRVVFLDDDPTGTQTITDLPVLTSWSVSDVQRALQQPTTGFFILTNTRSLSQSDAADLNREVVDALHQAADSEHVSYVIVSRSDSTLRGYFPLETDVLAEELAARGTNVDGVVVCPAYIEPGRLTVDSVHWARTNEGMIPVSHSEFAKDASFGYRNSDLRDWVEEKSGGRIPRDKVARITLNDIRVGGPDRVLEILTGLRDRQPVVVDTAADADQRVVVLGLLRAEAAGKNFIYRIGPSFVRARTRQRATPARRQAFARDLRLGTHRSRRHPPGHEARLDHGWLARRAHHPPAGSASRQGQDHRTGAGRSNAARRRLSRATRRRDRRTSSQAAARQRSRQRHRDSDQQNIGKGQRCGEQPGDRSHG